MPKHKTVRSAAKRFKVTGSGKLKHESSNRNHKLTKKTSDQRRRLRQTSLVGAGDEPKIKRMLGM